MRQRNGVRGGVEERRKEAPMAVLSQEHPQRVTVRQTDRTPPKVTKASTYQTQTGAVLGCASSVSTGHSNTPWAGSPIGSKTLVQWCSSSVSILCLSLCLSLPLQHKFGEITGDAQGHSSSSRLRWSKQARLNARGAQVDANPQFELLSMVLKSGYVALRCQ